MGLHPLHRRFKYTPNFELSPAGLLSIPPKLLEELKPLRFFMLKRPAPRLHSRFEKLFLQNFFLLPTYIYTDLQRLTIRSIMKPSVSLGSVAGLTTTILGLASDHFDPTSYIDEDVITRDILVVGGGASGAHAATSLSKMGESVFFPLPTTPTPLPYRDSTASGDQNDGFDSTHLPVPEQHWILGSIGGIFGELKERGRVMVAEKLNFVSPAARLWICTNPAEVEVNCDDCGRRIDPRRRRLF